MPITPIPPTDDAMLSRWIALGIAMFLAIAIPFSCLAVYYYETRKRRAVTPDAAPERQARVIPVVRTVVVQETPPPPGRCQQMRTLKEIDLLDVESVASSDYLSQPPASREVSSSVTLAAAAPLAAIRLTDIEPYRFYSSGPPPQPREITRQDFLVGPEIFISQP